MNAVCHNQLINSFLQTQHGHEICRSFSVLEMHTTHCSHHGSLCPSQNSHFTFFQAPCFTLAQYYWPYVTLVNAPFSFRGNLLPYNNSPHSLNLCHPHIDLTVIAASHRQTAHTLSPRYAKSLTVSNSSHNFPSCSTASPIFPSHFWYGKFLEINGATLFTPAY